MLKNHPFYNQTVAVEHARALDLEKKRQFSPAEASLERALKLAKENYGDDLVGQIHSAHIRRDLGLHTIRVVTAYNQGNSEPLSLNGTRTMLGEVTDTFFGLSADRRSDSPDLSKLIGRHMAASLTVQARLEIADAVTSQPDKKTVEKTLQLAQSYLNDANGWHIGQQSPAADRIPTFMHWARADALSPKTDFTIANAVIGCARMALLASALDGHSGTARAYFSYRRMLWGIRGGKDRIKQQIAKGDI